MKAVKTTAKLAFTTALAAVLTLAATACVTAPEAVAAETAVTPDAAVSQQEAAEKAVAEMQKKAAPAAATQTSAETTVRFVAMTPAQPQAEDDAETNSDTEMILSGSDEQDNAQPADGEETPDFSRDITDGVWLEYYVDGLCFNTYRFDDDGTVSMEFYEFAKELQGAPVHNARYDKTLEYTIDDDGTIWVGGAEWHFIENEDRISHYWTFYYFNPPTGPDSVLKEDYIYHHDEIPAMEQILKEGVENRNHI